MKSRLLLAFFAAALLIWGGLTWWNENPGTVGAADPEAEAAPESELGDQQQSTQFTEQAEAASVPDSTGQRVASPTTVRAEVTSQDRRPLRGTAYWLELTDALKNELASDLTIAPSTIWKLGNLQERPFEDGRLELDLAAETSHFLWLEVPGFHPRHWFLGADELPETIELSPCAAFEVELVDHEGQPISEASISIYHNGADKSLIDAGWQERLRKRYYQQSTSPNSEGVCRFEVLPESDVSIWVRADGPFGDLTRDSVRPVGSLRLQMRRAMTLVGTVHDVEGNPLPNTYVLCMQRLPGSQNRSDVGSTVSEEDGSFRTEKVSVSGVGLHAVAFRDGYEMTVVPLPHPKVGQEVRVDFKMHKAQPRKLRVLGAGGVALDGLVVEFARTPQDWLPFPETVSKEGFADLRPMLANGRDYILRAKSEGALVGTARFQTHAVDEAQTVRLEDLTRIEGTAPPAWNGKSVQFYSATRNCGPIGWTAGQPSPWLPSGPGWLVAEEQRQPVVLAPGLVDWPEPTAADQGQLRFRLALLKDETIEVLARFGHDLPDLALGTVRDGSNDMLLPLDAQGVRLVSSQRGNWDWGRLPWRDDVADLGTLTWPRSSALQVQVSRADRDPIPSTHVEVSDGRGRVYASGFTDADGLWQGPTLPPQRYEVVVSPNRGHSAPLPDRVIPFFPEQGTSTLHVEYAEGRELLIQSAARGSGRWQAQVNDAVGRTLQSTSDASGAMRFHGLEGPLRWIAWRVQAGEILVQAGEQASGSGLVRLTDAARSQIDVPGEEAGSVGLFVNGSLVAHASLDLGQKLRLAAPQLDSVELEWTGASGTGPRVRAWEALLTQELPGPDALPDAVELSCIDETGAAIAGVVGVLGRESGAVHFDGHGHAWVPAHADGDTVRAFATGHWDAVSRVSDGNVLELRRLTQRVTASFGSQAEALRLNPQFELSVPLGEATWSRGGGSRSELGRLPAGRYQVEWLDREGQVMDVTEVELAAGEAGTIEFDGD